LISLLRPFLILHFVVLKLFFALLLFASGLIVGGCTSNNLSLSPNSLNSRYNDEQPVLSGDGRWLAMVSNRYGRREVLLYDLQQQSFVDLPGLNLPNAITDSPSLSRAGRYIVYISSIQGRPDIFLYDRATKQNQLLTQGYRSWLRNPRVSPDGRYIVFETARRGQWDIEVMDLGRNMELDQVDGVVESKVSRP
jgi:Tol biopolymer transport system component